MARTPSLSAAQHVDIAGRYQDGATTYELAELYGCSDVAIGNALRRSGVALRRGGKQSEWTGSDEQRQRALELYRSGLSVKRVAAAFGCRTTAISELLASEGEPLKPGGRTKPRFDPTETERVADEYRAGASIQALATRYSCSTMAVKSALDRAGVPYRRMGRLAKWTPEFTAAVIQRYFDGETPTEMAAGEEVSEATVLHRLQQAGVRSRPVRRRENAPGWRGGRVEYSNGYVLVLPEDEDGPLVPEAVTARDGYVLEHRLVMARAIGRPLRKDETVHHVNGQRADNRLENLQLRSGAHGKGVALRCCDCGSSNVEPVTI